MGLIEIARRAGVRRPVVTEWRTRHANFPQPVANLQIGPVFWWPDVMGWLRATGRPFGLDRPDIWPAGLVEKKRTAIRAAASPDSRTLDRDQAIREEWAHLRAELPVEVEVVQCLTVARIRSGNHRYAEHIYVRDNLRIGRLHRAEGSTLCTTASSSPGGPSEIADAGEHLYPTCPICISTAYRVTGRTRSPLLLPHHRC